MKTQTKFAMIPLMLGSALALTACFDSDDDGGSGSLSLGITDAPVDDATAVIVEFNGVEVKPADGESISFDFGETRTINLLDLQGSASESLISDESVPAGDYDWVRLDVNAQNQVDDSYIEFDDGSRHSLFVPSGSQSGLKLVQGFTVPQGGSADFTIDFDLRKSITNPQSGQVDYILKPALRLVDNVEVGTLAGTVPSAEASASDCTGAVYVYEGHDATAGDEGSEDAPVTSSGIELDSDSGDYEYEVGFLLEGNYTAAFTCEAGSDDPEADDDITFIEQQNTSITANETTELNFGS